MCIVWVSQSLAEKINLFVNLPLGAKIILLDVRVDLLLGAKTVLPASGATRRENGILSLLVNRFPLIFRPLE